MNDVMYGGLESKVGYLIWNWALFLSSPVGCPHQFLC